MEEFLGALPADTAAAYRQKLGFLKPRSSQGIEQSRNEVDDPSFIFIQGTSVFGIQNKACLVVPVNVIQGSQSIPTNALIDSGAYDNFNRCRYCQTIGHATWIRNRLPKCDGTQTKTAH